QNYGSGQLVNVAGFAGGSATARVGALVASFSPLELVLIGLGGVGAYLWQRWYFWFVAIGLVVKGPIFAAFANINLGAHFAPWIFGRFVLLPHVLAAPLVAFGLAFGAYVLRELAAFSGRAVSSGVAAGAIAAPALILSAVTAAGAYRAVDQSG